MDKTREDYILFALRQMQDAIEFGFTQNQCNRNLKLALSHFWENAQFGFHTLGGKMRLPRSIAAAARTKDQVVTEHAVPKQVIVNMLVNMPNPTRRKVRNLLRRLWRVTLVTKEEDERLRSMGLRFKMPDGWDGRDPWARYKAAGIELNPDAIAQKL